MDAETVRNALAESNPSFDGQVTESRVPDFSTAAEVGQSVPTARCTSVVAPSSVARALAAADQDSSRAASDVDKRTAMMRDANCALKSELAASQDITKSAIATVRDLASYELSTKENAELLAAFDYFAKAYDGTTAAELIGLMKSKVELRGLNRLANLCLREVPVFGVRELARVAAYADFRSAVLGLPQPMHMEVRCEGWRAYCLLQLEDTVVRGVEGMGSSLLWAHDEACAKARFKDGGDHLGLIGMQIGNSTFVTAMPRSKGEALDLLGLRGCAAFEEPGGVLYCIRAALTPELLRRAKPMVPLLYNVASADHPGALEDAWVYSCVAVYVAWCTDAVVVHSLRAVHVAVLNCHILSTEQTKTQCPSVR